MVFGYTILLKTISVARGVHMYKYFTFLSITFILSMLNINICFGYSDFRDISKEDKIITHILNQYTDEVVKHKHYYYLLLIETALVESDMGVYKYNNGNYGYYQIRGTTGKELLSELKKSHPDIYKIVINYHNPKWSIKDNLTNNFEFATAMCVAYYCTKIKDPAKDLNSLEKRAKIWKKYYNTYAGAGSINKYISVNRTNFKNLKITSHKNNERMKGCH